MVGGRKQFRLWGGGGGVLPIQNTGGGGGGGGGWWVMLDQNLGIQNLGGVGVII